ncbi:MAG: tRNA pseudouridine(38-40) synthase TruA [Armatimonadetes bacterium]|nr:tRNA pseudouridine(38-40) synthase TruA [Armatimonadota bacterium]
MAAARTLKLTVEYDGTDFCGYQTQGQGERTVQATLARAVRTITQQDVTLHAAGRTDTGVHALGQVVSFQTTARVPTERLAIALNSVLPRDLSVAKAEDAPEGFHARFSARRRTYAYLIWTRRTRSAIWGRYSLHLRRSVDEDLMRRAGQVLIGSRDFAAFAKTGGDPGTTTVRDLQALAIRRLPQNWGRGGLILFRVTANGFLRSMVRNIVGALLEVGLGDLPPDAIADILATRDRAQNPCAPAAPHGLCLLRVDY